MLKISVEKTFDSPISINPMSIKRDWMDATPEKHAYRCFPVTQANMIGWSLSCNQDIKFIWDGINDTNSNHVKIIEEKDFLYTGRGQSTVSISTGLIFRTDSNISLITINPVNYFNNDFETMSSLISTSWYDTSLPLAIKAKTPNKEIVIKSGTPLATIMPISLTAMDGTEIDICDYSDPERKREKAHRSYGDAAQELNKKGEWTDWYRKAVNEKGESLGSHEVNVLHLSINDKTKNKRNDII